MRIAIGQLWQETNTFNPLPTTRGDFEEFGVVRGAGPDRAHGRHQRTRRLHPVAARTGRSSRRSSAWCACRPGPAARRPPRRSPGCATKCSAALEARRAVRCRAARPARRAGGGGGTRTSKGRFSRRCASVIGPRGAAGRHARPARQRHRANGRERRRPGAVPHRPAHRRLRNRAASRRAAPHPDRRRPPRDRLSQDAVVVPAERANTQDPAASVSDFARNWSDWNASRASWRPDWRRCSPGSTFRTSGVRSSS